MCPISVIKNKKIKKKRHLFKILFVTAAGKEREKYLHSIKLENGILENLSFEFSFLDLFRSVWK